MKYSFHPEAVNELVNLVRYYGKAIKTWIKFYIVAITHLTRKPGYWKERSSKS